jgi:uncharacterized integral membrane protein
MASDPASRSDRSRAPARTKREQVRLAVSFALGALAVLFAVLNLDKVEVNWIIGTWDTPLILVIAVCLLIGAGIGWVARGRR